MAKKAAKKAVKKKEEIQERNANGTLKTDREIRYEKYLKEKNK